MLKSLQSALSENRALNLRIHYLKILSLFLDNLPPLPPTTFSFVASPLSGLVGGLVGGFLLGLVGLVAGSVAGGVGGWVGGWVGALVVVVVGGFVVVGAGVAAFVVVVGA